MKSPDGRSVEEVYEALLDEGLAGYEWLCLCIRRTGNSDYEPKTLPDRSVFVQIKGYQDQPHASDSA